MYDTRLDYTAAYVAIGDADRDVVDGDCNAIAHKCVVYWRCRVSFGVRRKNEINMV